MARKVDLSVDVIVSIEERVKQGDWPNVVAKQLGIHGRTYSVWMQKGEKAHLEDTDKSVKDPGYLYRQLYERVGEAEAEAEIRILEEVRASAKAGRNSAGNTLLTLLERRFSDRWRRRDPTLIGVAETYEGQVKQWLASQAATPDAPPKLRAIE